MDCLLEGIGAVNLAYMWELLAVPPAPNQVFRCGSKRPKVVPIMPLGNTSVNWEPLALPGTSGRIAPVVISGVQKIPR